MTNYTPQRKVVYLFGAGASHACVDYWRSPHGILMRHLNRPIAQAVRAFVTSEGQERYRALDDLTNDLSSDHTDYEQLITFLDDSPSAIHRSFAAELRKQFEMVLRERLNNNEDELGKNRFALYGILLDMYNVKGCPEDLHAALTINYDNYIEAAATALGYSVDFGMAAPEDTTESSKILKLIKLHGSFYWTDAWPVLTHFEDEEAPLWIPPGIYKAKDRYPFNLLWGVARELLQCDLLRVVGCNLSGNDWDLLSLLFTTRHGGAPTTNAYEVEIIDSPKHARTLRRRYPYLDVRSMLEIEEMGVGRRIVEELTEGRHRSVESMSEEDLQAVDEMNQNWFLVWLRQMAVSLDQDERVVSVETRKGMFERIWEL